MRIGRIYDTGYSRVEVIGFMTQANLGLKRP